MPSYGQDNALANGLATLAKSLFPDPTREATVLYRRAQMENLGANAEYDRQRTQDLQADRAAMNEASARIASGDLAGAMAIMARGGRAALQYGPGFIAGAGSLPGSTLTPEQQARLQVGTGVQSWQNTEQGNLTRDLILGENQTGVLAPNRAAAMNQRPVVMGQRSAAPGETVVAPAGSGLPNIGGRDTETTARARVLNNVAPGLADGSTALTQGIMALIAPQGLAADIRGTAQRDVQGLRNEGNLAVQGLRNDGSSMVQGLRNEGNANVAGIGAAARTGAAEIGARAGVQREEMRQTGANQRNELTNTTRADGYTVGGEARRYAADRGVDAAQVRADGQVQAAQARGGNGAGRGAQPPVVRDRDAGAMRTALAARIERQYGFAPTPEFLDGLVPKATAEFQRTRDIAAAVDGVVSTLGPKENVETKGIIGNRKLSGFRQAQPEAAPAQAPAQPSSGNAPNDALQQARDAIARGAPRDKVLERLRGMGINPEGL